jgi:hypothetical protein
VTFFWPTPNASDGKVGIVDRSRLETLIRTGKAKKRKDGGDYQIKLLERVISEEIRQARLTSRPQINLNDQVGGQLNPTWVEWLMGFPAGWTELPPSGTRSSRKSSSSSAGASSATTRKPKEEGKDVPSQWKDCRRPPGVVPEFLLVTGTRTFDDYELLEWKLDLVTYFWDDVAVCHGHSFHRTPRGHTGADWHAEKWAEKNWYDRHHYIADWEKYGKAAGPRRNGEMCRFVAAQDGTLVAFWDGKSKGTADCVRQFRALSPRVHVVRY